MNTRKLIHEDEFSATYEVSDPNGNVVGTDVESKAPAEPSVEDRLAHIEQAIKSASSLDDLKQRIAAEPAAESK